MTQQGYRYGYGAPAYGYRPAPPVPVAPDGRPLADFASRLLAFMIDSALFAALFMLLFYPAVLVLLLREWPPTFPQPGQAVEPVVPLVFVGRILLLEAVLIAVMLVLYYLYYVEMMLRRGGQTLGKKALKIRVVPLEPGARLTRAMVARRYLVEFLGGTIVPFFGLVDGLWQLRDEPYQQTLHDRFAKTVVVKVSP